MDNTIYLITGKGNNLNNFPFAFSKNLNRAKLFAQASKHDRLSIKKVSYAALLNILEHYYLLNLD